MVWSDPEDVETWAISPRGAGWLFGAKVTNEVREKNKLIKNVKKNEGHITHYRSILQCLINLFDRPATKNISIKYKYCNTHNHSFSFLVYAHQQLEPYMQSPPAST